MIELPENPTIEQVRGHRKEWLTLGGVSAEWVGSFDDGSVSPRQTWYGLILLAGIYIEFGGEAK